MEIYLTTLAASCCCFLGGLVIKQDRGRIKKLEVEQNETTKLLHDVSGKLDVLIELIKKNGK